jgi:hypothetical protein
MLNGILAAVEVESGRAGGEQRDRALVVDAAWHQVRLDGQQPQVVEHLRGLGVVEHDPGAVISQHLAAELGVQGLEHPPRRGGVGVDAVGRAPLPGDLLGLGQRVLERVRAGDRLELAVRVEQAGLLADLRVVEQHERVRVDRDRVDLPVDQAFLPGPLVEHLGLHAVPRQVLGTQLLQQVPRCQGLHPGQVRHRDVGRPVADGGERELGVEGVSPRERHGLQVDVRVGRTVGVLHLLHADAVTAAKEVPERQRGGAGWRVEQPGADRGAACA